MLHKILELFSISHFIDTKVDNNIGEGAAGWV